MEMILSLASPSEALLKRGVFSFLKPNLNAPTSCGGSYLAYLRLCGPLRNSLSSPFLVNVEKFKLISGGCRVICYIILYFFGVFIHSQK